MFTEFDEKVAGSVMLPRTGDEMGVMYCKDVVYCAYGDTQLHLQILVPTSGNRRAQMPMPPEMRERFGMPEFHPDWSYPCLVYVPGSAWAKQNCYGDVANFPEFVKMGYVVAIVEYRDYTIAPFPAPIVDARNAVRYLKKNAAQYCIDPERMVLAGSSSGGHTSAYAGIFHDDDEETNLFPGISGEVQGLINFFGSTDFTFEDSNPVMGEKHNRPDSPEGMEMGGIDLTQRPDLVEKLTVACNIFEDTQIAPMLIFHGTADNVVNCRCSVNLYRRLIEMKKDAMLYILKGSGHGGPEFFAPRILQIMNDFFLRLAGK